MKHLTILFAAFFLFTACNHYTQKEKKMIQSNKEKVVALLTSIETGDPTPIGYINPEKYVQHNLMVGDGL